MAHVKQQATGFKGKHFNNAFTHGGPSHNAKRKRKWVPDNKLFYGGVKEGQGFAFKQKEKIKHEYSKLLRRERWTKKQSNVQWEEEYPEHLKHLYLAEKKRLDEAEQENRNKRRLKGKAVDSEGEGEQTIAVGSSSGNNESSTTLDIDADQSNSSKEAEIAPQAEMCGESSQNSNNAPFIQTKKKNLSSYQKTKQEYERIKEERERKREEYLKNKAQREEALKKYKEKKMATYRLLKKKTKKGQPNLNLQMELLLQKIQAQQK